MLKQLLSPPEKIWYLPHHPVTSPNKAVNVRRVANTVSVFKKQALNKNFFSGPDFLNNLIVLPFRFRQDPLALLPDKKAKVK